MKSLTKSTFSVLSLKVKKIIGIGILGMICLQAFQTLAQTQHYTLSINFPEGFVQFYVVFEIENHNFASQKITGKASSLLEPEKIWWIEGQKGQDGKIQFNFLDENGENMVLIQLFEGGVGIWKDTKGTYSLDWQKE